MLIIECFVISCALPSIIAVNVASQSRVGNRARAKLFIGQLRTYERRAVMGPKL